MSASGDYISREAAEERLLHMAEVANSAYDGLYNSQIVMLAQNVIHMLPAADVRPVVTCSDCKWWTKQESSLQGRCELLQMYPTGAWFCANGKREKC